MSQLAQGLGEGGGREVLRGQERAILAREGSMGGLGLGKGGLSGDHLSCILVPAKLVLHRAALTSASYMSGTDLRSPIRQAGPLLRVVGKPIPLPEETIS